MDFGEAIKLLKQGKEYKEKVGTEKTIYRTCN